MILLHGQSNRSMLLQWRTLTLSFAVALLMAVNLSAAYEIRGKISATCYDGEHKGIKQEEYFDVTIAGNDFQVRLSSLKNTNISFYQFGTMPNGSYKLVSFNSNVVVSESTLFTNGNPITIKYDKPVRPLNSATLTLNKGTIPPLCSCGIMQVAWLAFGSVKQNEGNSIHETRWPKIFSFVEDSSKRDKIRVMYRQCGIPPFQLESLYQGLNGDMKAGEMLFEDKKNDGECLYYVVKKWTNINGFCFAKQFVAVNYLMNPKEFKLKEPMQKWIYYGETHEITTDSNQVPLLNVPAMTRVVENRLGDEFAAIGSFAYISTNGQLWENVKVQTVAAEMLKRISNGKHSGRTESHGVYIIIVFVSLIIPYIYWRSQITKSTNK